MFSTVALTRLLQQFLRLSSRQDKTFDKYKIKFLKKLQSVTTNESAIELFDECTKQLKSIPNLLEDNLSEGRLVIRQATYQLQQIESLSSSIQKQLLELGNAPEPYNINEHQFEFKSIIKIYQRAVIELSKRSMQFESDINRDIDYINDDLQQIILELDVGEDYAKKLEQLRILISNESDPFKLPHHCLQVINIIVDSTREERRTSRHFLYTLNDSLTQFYLSFAQTLKVTEDEFEQQKEMFFSIQKNAILLKEKSKNVQSVDVLHKYIASYVDDLQKAMLAQEKQQEEKFRFKFQGMVRQIKELQNETQSYQKTLKQQNKQLHIDFLTKIPNRAAWSERLENEIIRFKRYKTPLNMAIIDIDNFKSINDNFGHLVGDKVLNVIAQTLQKSIRNADYIARYGGEEFALLLPEISEKQSMIALQKLCQRIKNIPFKFKKENLVITISIGFTTFTETDNADETFERADTALYQAKNSGKNQVKFLGRTTS